MGRVPRGRMREAKAKPKPWIWSQLGAWTLDLRWSGDLRLSGWEERQTGPRGRGWDCRWFW